MNKKSKIITGSIVAILAVAGVGYGVYANFQHHKEVKVEAVHKLDITRETKVVDDLQKTFTVANADSEKVLSELTGLKLSTNEAKKIQSKAISTDKKAFDTLATQNIAKLNISTKDSKFNVIATLQANIQALNSENKKLSAMTTIFTTDQIKNYSNQITEIIKVENSQISALQKSRQAFAAKAEASAQAKKSSSTMNVNQIKNGDTTIALNSISGTWTNSSGQTIEVASLLNSQQTIIVINSRDVIIAQDSVSSTSNLGVLPNGDGFSQGELTGGMLDMSIDGSTSSAHLVLIPAGVKFTNPMAPGVSIQDNTDSSRDRMIIVTEAVAGIGAITVPIDSSKAYYLTSSSVGN